jgi:hypothetical protein
MPRTQSAIRSAQLVRGSQLGQVAAHPGGIGDDPRVLRVGLALAAEYPGHAVHYPAGHVDDFLAAGQQDREQQRGGRGDQVHRPPHLAAPGTLGGTADQFLDRLLAVGHLDRPQLLPAGADRRRVVAGLAGIDPDPHHIRGRHLSRLPALAGKARGRPRHQVPEQRRFASDLSQRPGRPGQRGGHSFQATTAATSHQPHPISLGIQSDSYSLQTLRS